MKAIPDLFKPVAEVIAQAELVATDGCHKIYLAMDEEQAEWFRDNYEFVFEHTADEMLDRVIEWYEDSCSLRFVSAVRTNHADPNEGFTDLIPQGIDWDDDEEDK